MELNEFVKNHSRVDTGEVFQLENSKLLEIKVNGTVWAKTGSMIGYYGNLKFTHSSGGFGKWLKKGLTGEGANTMQVSGDGYLYLGDQGKVVHVLKLKEGEAISINGNDILAFEDTVNWDIKMMRKMAGMMSGGLFNVHIQGPGHVAFTSHGKPLVLGTPVITDPQATIAWSAHLQPSIKSDINFKTLMGSSSGETFQMAFNQEGGFVIIQPFEEGITTAK